MDTNTEAAVHRPDIKLLSCDRHLEHRPRMLKAYLPKKTTLELGVFCSQCVHFFVCQIFL